ncbi:MAG: T9SS type A sorting domain-containing protein [Bacteroidales bacterium]|nr:T9SS type A sorting domain-containing protein [Bacteroidales bacterium]
MKRLFLHSFFVVSSFIAYSQYIPMLEDSCTWNVYYSFESAWNKIFKVMGDTSINSTEYKAISYLEEVNPNQFWGGISGFYREDTMSQKVYQYQGTNGDFLLYDFSLIVGDTFNYGSSLRIIDSITNDLILYPWGTGELNIELDGRRVFYLSDQNGYTIDIWIEGIGSVSGIESNYSGGNDILLCHFNKAGDLDFHLNSDSSCYGTFYLSVSEVNIFDVSIFPNPSSGSVHISGLQESPYQLAIYDISGKHILQMQIESNETTIQLDGMRDGVYILVLRNQHETIRKRLIVSRE